MDSCGVLLSGLLVVVKGATFVPAACSSVPVPATCSSVPDVFVGDTPYLIRQWPVFVGASVRGKGLLLCESLQKVAVGI